MAKIESLADLTPDPKNPRRHGERNIGIIEKSLEMYGAARSIVVDEEGRILAGNGVVEAAGNIGIEKVIPIEVTGNEIVAVVRKGLTEEQKLGIAVSDNRAGELSEWNLEALAEIGEKVDLSTMFTAEELGELLSDVEHMKEKEEELKSKKFVRVLVSVPIDNAADAKELLDQLSEIKGIEIDYSAN